MDTKEKTGYKRIIDFFTEKRVGIAIAVLFAASLIPIIYVGFFNYASGDDYWYGIYTYRGYVEEGISGALQGSVRMVREFYQNWQGTWFTMFLFTLSPNHFWEKGYSIVVFLSLGLLTASVNLLANQYLVKKLKFGRGTVAAMTCMVLYLALQYIPRTTSGIYWFNGIMHYSVPFFLGAVALVCTQRFVEEKKKKDYILLFICFTLLGGGSYLAPVAATLAACLILLSRLEIKEIDIRQRKLILNYDWRNLWVLAAFAAELTGLLISFLAPGNSVRGGEEFGFSLKWALQCIVYAIDRGIYLGEDYFLKNPVTTIFYLMLAVILWQQMWKVDKEKYKFRYPLLFVVYMNGIYWASYTPEIYSRSDVSGGVPNTYFHIFLLITLASMIYVHGWIQRKLWLRWEKQAAEQGIGTKELAKTKILYGEGFKHYLGGRLLAVGILAFLTVGQYSDIITTNEYCLEAIESGQLQKYAGVRRQQHQILMDENVEEALIPEMEAPYPLLHMVLSDDETMSRNVDRAKYYHKTSVKAYRVN